MQNPVRRDTPQGRADLDPMSPATARGQATAALGASGRPPVPKACSIAKVSEHCVQEANGCGPGVGTSGKGTKASIQAPSMLRAGPKWPRGKYGGLGTEARGVLGEAQEGSYLCSGEDAVECGSSSSTQRPAGPGAHLSCGSRDLI